jgi:hypothetical protein
MHPLELLIEKQVNSVQRSEEHEAQIEKRLREITVWLRTAPFATGMSLYTQGSVRLDTSIAPEARASFDADLVCHLPRQPWESRPFSTFEMVGSHLSKLPGFRGELKRKRRCWTLTYNTGFHVDITPAIDNGIPHARSVSVFDGPSQSWRISDPVGYSAWFTARSNSAQGKLPRKRDVNRQVTPLISVVQLLKRRRDLHFDGPDAPNSIVLTTLAASIYSGEPTTVEALSKVLRGMLAGVDGFNIRGAVGNPVNPSEVFSENWIGKTSAIRAFLQFLKDLQSRLAMAEQAKYQHRATSHLNDLFGESGSIN